MIEKCHYKFCDEKLHLLSVMIRGIHITIASNIQKVMKYNPWCEQVLCMNVGNDYSISINL